MPLLTPEMLSRVGIDHIEMPALIFEFMKNEDGTDIVASLKPDSIFPDSTILNCLPISVRRQMRSGVLYRVVLRPNAHPELCADDVTWCSPQFCRHNPVSAIFVNVLSLAESILPALIISARFLDQFQGHVPSLVSLANEQHMAACMKHQWHDLLRKGGRTIQFIDFDLVYDPRRTLRMNLEFECCEKKACLERLIPERNAILVSSPIPFTNPFYPAVISVLSEMATSAFSDIEEQALEELQLQVGAIVSNVSHLPDRLNWFLSKKDPADC